MHDMMSLRGLRFALVLSLACCGMARAEFTVPTREQCRQATGSLLALEPPLRRAFADDVNAFSAKKAPRPMDWLAAHEEDGQTFQQYLGARPNIPNTTRKKLYILPIGEFAKERAPDLTLLKNYTAAYFQPLAVELLPVVADAAVPAASRVNAGTGQKQWKSTDILAWMPKQLPADAFAMIAVTMTDLYPDERWNFVFGQASYTERVGVFSFARYHPAWRNETVDAATSALVLRRSAKVLTHEMGHMFGIAHCIYYECNMNGANHLAEADATPMHLCPVCLRKLHHALRFEPAKRYSALETFYSTNQLTPERDWVKLRVEALNASP